MHSRQQAQAFVQPPPPLPPNTQAQCRRRGERQVTKNSRKRRPRPHCCIWSPTHVPSTVCRCTLCTGSLRRCCRSKQPPPWAARPPRPAAPEGGMRAPPGPEDGSDAPVTWAAGFLDTGRRRCRLRSATATPHVRQRGQHICQYSTNIITMRKRAVAQEYTASAQRSAETTAQRAQGGHTASAGRAHSAERANSCCNSDHNSEHGERTAVTGVRERGT